MEAVALYSPLYHKGRSESVIDHVWPSSQIRVVRRHGEASPSQQAYVTEPTGGGLARRPLDGRGNAMK